MQVMMSSGRAHSSGVGPLAAEICIGGVEVGPSRQMGIGFHLPARGPDGGNTIRKRGVVGNHWRMVGGSLGWGNRLPSVCGPLKCASIAFLSP
jgi:hypothetical protein